MSLDASFQVFRNSNGLYIYNNTNKLWEKNNDAPIGSGHISMNSTGQYMTLFQITQIIRRTDAFLYSGDLYYSTNFGKTWNKSDLVDEYICNVCINYNGTTMICGTINGIYLSTDYGNTWEQDITLNSNIELNNDINTNFISTMAMDLSGICISLSIANIGIYTTKNKGAGWSKSLDNKNIVSISIDNSGKYICAVSSLYDLNNGSIFISSNYGDTFVKSNTPIKDWKTIKISGNGKKIYASCYYAYTNENGNLNGDVYVSYNYGTTWVVDAYIEDNYINSISTDDTGLITLANSQNNLYTYNYNYIPKLELFVDFINKSNKLYIPK